MKICCFGSLNLDMVFSVKEFVQPKETIHSQGFNIYPGGKGLNQAMAIQKSGVDVMMAGSIGRDGQILLDVAKNMGLDYSNVRVTDVNTGLAVIQVNGAGENCIILYDGANKENDKKFIDQVMDQLSAGDFLILQNEINNLDYIMTSAHERKIRMVLNPSPYEDQLNELPLEYCDYIILNEVEGEAMAGEKEAYSILKALTDRLPNTGIILTKGSEGVYYSSDGHVGHQNAFQVQAVDTTGAGDAFTGYFIGMIAKGKTIAEAVTTAQKAAAISVTQKGAAESIPFYEEVLNTEF